MPPLTFPSLPPLPPLSQLSSLLGATPELLQEVISTGGGTAVTGGVTTGGVTTGVVTTPVTTTTVPQMMTMAPLLPAVALGIVKAIFISKFQGFNPNPFNLMHRWSTLSLCLFHGLFFTPIRKGFRGSGLSTHNSQFFLPSL